MRRVFYGVGAVVGTIKFLRLPSIDTQAHLWFFFFSLLDDFHLGMCVCVRACKANVRACCC